MTTQPQTLKVIVRTDYELLIQDLTNSTVVDSIHAVVHPTEKKPYTLIRKVFNFLNIRTNTINNSNITVKIPNNLSTGQMLNINNAFRLYSSHKKMISILISRYNSIQNVPEGKEKLKEVINHLSIQMNEYLQYLLQDRRHRARSLMSQFNEASNVAGFTNPKKLTKEQMLQKIEKQLKRLPKKDVIKAMKNL
jgi:hypothetical protein